MITSAQANAEYRIDPEDALPYCYTMAINEVNIYTFWFMYIINGVIEVLRRRSSIAISYGESLRR